MMVTPGRTHPNDTLSVESFNTDTAAVVSAEVQVIEIGLDEMDDVRVLNRSIFGEERIINKFDKPDLLMLVARLDGETIGFKIGYGESPTHFYSAKGGVLDAHRRHGIATLLLHEMEMRVRKMGYKRFAYDTFPNRHPGMLILGLNTGYRVVNADFNQVYRDYRIRLEKRL